VPPALTPSLRCLPGLCDVTGKPCPVFKQLLLPQAETKHSRARSGQMAAADDRENPRAQKGTAWF
jgi:hypothetical protein